MLYIGAKDATAIASLGSYAGFSSATSAFASWLPGLPLLDGPLAQLMQRWRAAQLASPGELEPSRCDADSLSDLRLSAGLMTHLTRVTTTRLSLFCWTASSVVTQTLIFTHSIFHSQPLQVRPRNARTLVPWQHLRLRSNPPSLMGLGGPAPSR